MNKWQYNKLLYNWKATFYTRWQCADGLQMLTVLSLQVSRFSLITWGKEGGDWPCGQRGANHTKLFRGGSILISIWKICAQWQVGVMVGLAPLPRSSYRVQLRGNPVWKYISVKCSLSGKICFSCVGTIRSIVSLQWWFLSWYFSGAKPHTCGVLII
jgi:hypothetical protein